MRISSKVGPHRLHFICLGMKGDWKYLRQARLKTFVCAHSNPTLAGTSGLSRILFKKKVSSLFGSGHLAMSLS